MAVNPPTQRARTLDVNDEVSFVPMEAVGEYGGLDLMRTKQLEEIGTGYTAFEDGDIIIAKITPCFENGKGSVACGLKNGVGFGTTELHVLRAGNRLDRQFLFYLTISHSFRKLGESEMYGAGGQKRVPPEFVKDFPIPLPPIDEQHSIVRFLNAKTALIDDLVAKKQQMIDRLKEKRRALIAHTVTQGLPPNAAMPAGLEPNPERKKSGVEWLDLLPKDWQILPMTKCLTEMSDYRGKTPEKTSDGIFLVTARNVRFGYIDYECSKEYVAAEDYDEIMRRGLPKVGDILFTTEAPLGNVALVDREDIALAQRIIRFRMRKSHFHSRFVLYAMLADYFQLQLRRLSTGSTAEGLKASKLSILRLVAPPIAEQEAIANFLDLECEKIDKLIKIMETAISRMDEYRHALITATVNGRIDVRELA
jgi:type I restriction enzyme S subunit